jgi:hypothetical protein
MGSDPAKTVRRGPGGVATHIQHANVLAGTEGRCRRCRTRNRRRALVFVLVAFVFFFLAPRSPTTRARHATRPGLRAWPAVGNRRPAENAPRYRTGRRPSHVPPEARSAAVVTRHQGGAESPLSVEVLLRRSRHHQPPPRYDPIRRDQARDLRPDTVPAPELRHLALMIECQRRVDPRRPLANPPGAHRDAAGAPRCVVIVRSPSTP